MARGRDVSQTTTRLDRIAQRRAGPVRFQRRIKATTSHSFDEPLLRRAVRRRQACARPVLLDR